MRTRTILTALVLGALCATAGCWFRGPGPGLRRDVSRAANLELDREFGLRVGPVGMFLVRKGLQIAGEDDIPVHGVRHVHLGVYKVVEPRVVSASSQKRRSLCSARLADWELVVRVCEGDEHVLLFVRQDQDRIRGALVMVQDQEEVVVIRARGRLERALRGVLELARVDDDVSLFPRRRRDPTEDPPALVDEPDEPPAPMIAVCPETAPGAAGGGAPSCADPAEARERVLEVARSLSPGDSVRN